MEFVHQPSQSNRLGDYLKENLSRQWTHFRAAVAFVKRSGTRHLVPALVQFARTSHVEIIAGIDHRGTSSEGLQDLLKAVSPKGRIIVFHNRLPFTFHPKIYLFKSATTADVTIGSGNLTEGGLFTNYEAAIRISLDLTDAKQAEMLQSVERVLDIWADPSNGTSLILDTTLLAKLTVLDFTPSEEFTISEPANPRPNSDKTQYEHTSLPFAAHGEFRAPSLPTSPNAPEASLESMGSVATDIELAPLFPVLDATGFVMTLQRTDVGVGQTTTGTSRRSPEIFVPLVARDAAPHFWNWPDSFAPDPQRPDKLDRKNVRMRLSGKVVSVNMMTWPVKRDFRLRSEALRRAGNIGDILCIEKAGPTANYEYNVEVIQKGTSRHSTYLALCTQSVRNSEKKYGYY